MAIRQCTIEVGVGVLGREFMPVYEKAAKLDMPNYVHPTSPINARGMGDNRLVAIMGFGVNTRLTILKLVFTGVMKRLPRLKLVATHTGGVFPYLCGRIGIAAMHPGIRMFIRKPPSEYFNRVWLNTICYDTDGMASSLAFWGPEKTLLGSDYLVQIGDLENFIGRVRMFEIDAWQNEQILGGNAAKLLKLR